eukprot:7485313-Pyramimonas_sp.AAC.1
MTPEEMFREILKGQSEVPATVSEFKASVASDSHVMEQTIDKTTTDVKTLSEQMKQAQADIQNLKNGDAQSCTSGSTRYGPGDAGSGAGYNSNWAPSYIEFKSWISREGWKNREIKQREAMKQQVLTDNITKLLGLASQNTGRHWPYTRGRIYFKKGTAAEII